MLSVAAMHKNSLSYYSDLAREDYYLNGDQSAGTWYGRGARALGLSGLIRQEDYHQVFRGFSPDGQTKLVRNAGTDLRHPGQDLTFSAPKSVSVVWGLSKTRLRKQIEALVRRAAMDALRYLEDCAVFTRRGRDGAVTERAVGMVAALFMHGTSRAQDPQLHLHALVGNLALRRDGTWGSMLGITARNRKEDRLQTRSPLFREKMAAGALFRASLAAGLEQELGFRIRRQGNGFEIEGVSAALIRQFSTRRQEIAAVLKTWEKTDAKSAARATILTRKRKTKTASDELFKGWQERSGGLDVSALRDKVQPRDQEEALASALEAAKKKLSSENTPLSLSRTVRRTAEEAQGRGIDASAVLRAVERLFTLPLRAPVDKEADREARAANRRVRRSARSRAHPVSIATSLLAQKQVEFLQKRPFSPEERDALRRLTRARGNVQVLPKSERIKAPDVLASAHLAWERSGYKVLLATSSSERAKDWEKKTGIHAISLRGLISGLTTNRGLLRGYNSALQKADRLGLGFRSAESFLRYMIKASGKWIKFDEKTVLVLDRPRAMSLGVLGDLIKRVDRAGAKLVILDETRPSHEKESSPEAISRLIGAKQIRAELVRTLEREVEPRR